ncbi:hypothetical protein HDZ31DRAFT_72001 [Schizophyllum fasciatum]
MLGPILTILFFSLSATAPLAAAHGLKSVSTAPTGQSTAGNWTLQPGAHGGYALGGGKPFEQQFAAYIEGGRLMMACPLRAQAVLVPSMARTRPETWTVEFVTSTAGLPARAIVDGWTTTEDKGGLPTTGRYTKIVNSIGNYGGYYALAPPQNAGEGRTLAWFNRDVSAHGNAQWWLIFDENADPTC